MQQNIKDYEQNKEKKFQEKNFKFLVLVNLLRAIQDDNLVKYSVRH